MLLPSKVILPLDTPIEPTFHQPSLLPEQEKSTEQHGLPPIHTGAPVAGAATLHPSDETRENSPALQRQDHPLTEDHPAGTNKEGQMGASLSIAPRIDQEIARDAHKLSKRIWEGLRPNASEQDPITPEDIAPFFTQVSDVFRTLDPDLTMTVSRRELKDRIHALLRERYHLSVSLRSVNSAALELDRICTIAATILSIFVWIAVLWQEGVMAGVVSVGGLLLGLGVTFNDSAKEYVFPIDQCLQSKSRTKGKGKAFSAVVFSSLVSIPLMRAIKFCWMRRSTRLWIFPCGSQQ